VEPVKESKECTFVKSLEKLYHDKDRAALAKLRRGLGKKGGTPEMCRYVAPYLPDDAKPHVMERYFLIASLFALHPDPATRGTSMGKVFRAMMETSQSVEKRFENLLTADAEDLSGYLRQAISLAKSKKVRVDFHQLFYDIDLKNWNRPDRRVQLQWARDFWGYEKGNTETEADSKGE
jgi:CRISPR system Cascade subunit CasB